MSLRKALRVHSTLHSEKKCQIIKGQPELAGWLRQTQHIRHGKH